jgi:hypothetical protein
MPKYSNDNKALLSNDLYFEVLERKGVKSLVIRRTTTFSNLQGTEFDVTAEHVWAKGDSLHKLSIKYFGERQYWWTIGLTNSKPTDAHFSIGDVVYIPSNPYHIAELLK